jgi:hypothetical protein
MRGFKTNQFPPGNTRFSRPRRDVNRQEIPVMKSSTAFKYLFVAGQTLVIVALGVSARVPIALAEEKLTEPIYRVANETPAAAAQSAAPAAGAPSSATTVAKAPFDLTLQQNEHKLAPVIRVLKTCQDEIDRNVRDYSCTLVKRERVDGDLLDYEHIYMKVMHQPFSVYMSFLKPYTGREVVYIAGQNNGSMVVLDAGFKRMLGKMNLDPNGTLAMRGQKHPITDVGIRNLTAKLTKLWEAETQFGECDVTTNANTKINGRSTTMVQVVHPTPRQEFTFNVSRLFLDNELKVPIHFDGFKWPEKQGAEPPLEESYTYTNLKLNNGFTARDFDANNNPEIFKQ